MVSVNLKSYSVPDLLALREQVDQQLNFRRSELQTQLAQIAQNARTKTGSGIAGMKVAPKYRHPETGETWSGRGGVAGWLAKEIEAGKSREDFLIATKRKARSEAAPSGRPAKAVKAATRRK